MDQVDLCDLGVYLKLAEGDWRGHHDRISYLSAGWEQLMGNKGLNWNDAQQHSIELIPLCFWKGGKKEK